MYSIKLSINTIKNMMDTSKIKNAMPSYVEFYLPWNIIKD